MIDNRYYTSETTSPVNNDVIIVTVICESSSVNTIRTLVFILQQTGASGGLRNFSSLKKFSVVLFDCDRHPTFSFVVSDGLRLHCDPDQDEAATEDE